MPTKSSAYLSLCKFKCIDASMCLSYPKNSHQLEIFNHCSLLCILGYSLYNVLEIIDLLINCE